MSKGPAHVYRQALVSDCGTYRYTLLRSWDSDKPRILWVLLNPSTADYTKDDATSRRGVGYSKLWGFGSMMFVNLFAYRATQPKVMKKQPSPIGPLNNLHLEEQAKVADQIVCAWGTNGDHHKRDEEVVKLLLKHAPVLWCLGLTKGGHPVHPLRQPKDARLVVYRTREES